MGSVGEKKRGKGRVEKGENAGGTCKGQRAGKKRNQETGRVEWCCGTCVPRKSGEGLSQQLVVMGTMTKMKVPSYSELELVCRLLINRAEEINSVNLIADINPQLRQYCFPCSVLDDRRSEKEDPAWAVRVPW